MKKSKNPRSVTIIVDDPLGDELEDLIGEISPKLFALEQKIREHWGAQDKLLTELAEKVGYANPDCGQLREDLELESVKRIAESLRKMIASQRYEWLLEKLATWNPTEWSKRVGPHGNPIAQ